MDTIKEQLRELGFVKAESNKPNLKLEKFKDVQELDINHQVLMKLLELIISRKPFLKATSYISNQKLLLQPSIKKKLKRLYEESVKNNYLDEVEFSKYILNLDFGLAKERFSKRQKLRKERKANLSTSKNSRKNKKIYKWKWE